MMVPENPSAIVQEYQTDNDVAKKAAKNALNEVTALDHALDRHEGTDNGVEFVDDGELNAEWHCPQDIKDAANSIRVQVNKVLEALGQ